MADDLDIVGDIANGDLDAGNAGTVAASPAPAGTVPARGADAIHVNETTRAPTDAKATNLRDQLSAAFKGTDGEPTDQQSGQPRGPDGKFAPKATDTQAATDAPVQTGDNTAQPVQAPVGMSPAEAQQFAALPAETQQFVARTMAAVEANAARYRGYDQLEQVIGPRRQAWAINGVSEAQAVNQLLALSDFAGKSPPDFVRWFSAQHGIDLSTLADEGGDEYIDPKVRELETQVANLTGQLTNFTQGQATAQHNSLVELTAAFATEAGQDGQPLRPYFAELGTAITPFVQQVKAQNPTASPKEVLAEAYERACWATPTVRAKLLASQEATRLAEQRATVAARQAAGSSVTGQAPAPGSTQPKDIGNGSVRDTLRAAISQHSV